MHEEAIAARRRLFPRGLVQPAGSYRFGADALLLAAWSAAGLAPEEVFRFADVGTGCGAAGLALLLLRPGAHGMGMDREPDLIRAAETNARALGLEDRFAAVYGDVGEPSTVESFGPCELVLSNPPWHEEGRGRPPVCGLRRRALFGGPKTLSLFARACARLLTTTGRCCTAVGAFRAQDQRAALEQAGLFPCRLREVRSVPGRAPWLTLIEARSVPACLHVEPPLVLEDGRGKPTDEARALCPFFGAASEPDRA